MALPLLAVFAQLGILFLISRAVTRSIYLTIFVLTRSRTVAVSLVTALLFPGTVIHELSHLFTAEILGVRTGKLSLAPESIRETRIATGSVMVEETDPFRRTAIGLAPMVTGTIILAVASYFFMPALERVLAGLLDGFAIGTNDALLALGLGYLIFSVSGSMFSSPEDLKGAPAVLGVVAVLIAALYLIGIRIPADTPLATLALRGTTSLAQSLLVAVILTILLLILSKAALSILTKLLGIRITHNPR